jgi:hypothetical protein
MIGIVVIGTIVMDSGILLLAWERWRAARRPASKWLSPASMGRIGPLLEHIAAVEDEMVRLDRAIDSASPEQPESDHEHHPPTCDELAEAYTSAGARLVALSSAHLHRPPSDALKRFVAFIPDLGHDLDDDARLALLRNLDAVGDALREDSRQFGPPSGQATADLEEVGRELRRAVVARLDSLRPLLVKGRRRVLRKRDRAMLVEQLTGAARQLAAADALWRTAPLESLRALAAIQLPAPAARPPDAVFATGCRTVEAGLRVCAAHGDACLSLQIAHYAAAIDEQLDRLHTAVAAETKECKPSAVFGPVLVDQSS